MPLMPKRVKYRKTQRGSRKGTASRNLRIDFGEFGLQTLERAWITNTQIEAARVALTRNMKRKGKLWIRIFPDKSVTGRPPEPSGPVEKRERVAALLGQSDTDRENLMEAVDAWRQARRVPMASIRMLGAMVIAYFDELSARNVVPRNTIRREPVLANGPKLTGLAPHALKFSTRDPAGCGDKSGAAQS